MVCQCRPRSDLQIGKHPRVIEDKTMSGEQKRGTAGLLHRTFGDSCEEENTVIRRLMTRLGRRVCCGDG